MSNANAAASNGRTTSTVVLVEDEPLYRDLLRLALDADPELTVVGAYSDASSALSALEGRHIDVALLDIDLPGNINGIELGVRLRRRIPDVGIVLLSNHADAHLLASLPNDVTGGWSYLLKKSVADAGALRRAIGGAIAGLVVLDPALTMNARPRTGSDLARLSPRGLQILSLIAQGYSNTAIAGLLVLSEKSVENHVTRIYSQLGIMATDRALHARVQAVLAYLRGTVAAIA